MKKYLLLLFIPALVFAFGSGTIKKIDQIENNTGNDIVLKPDSSVKIDTLSGNFALQSGSLKEVEESTVSSTELSYLFGVTSAIQSQINGREPTLPNTTNGDLLYYNGGQSALAIGTLGQLLTVDGSGFPSWANPPTSVSVTTKGDIQTYSTLPDRLAVGSDTQILSADSSEPTGLKWITQPSTSPTTTQGDLILRGALVDERLPIGTLGKLLTSNGTTASWEDAPVSLPSQAGESGKYLKTNGTIAAWNTVANDARIVRNNFLECPSFNGCAPEGTVTVGSGIDLSGTTTRTVEASAFNTQKLNVLGSAADTLSYAYTKTANFDGKQLLARCEIKTTRPETYFRTYVNGVVQNELLISTDDSWKYYEIPLTGGATSQGYAVESATASSLGFDIVNCKIGKPDEGYIQDVGQAHFVGSLMYKAASCSWVLSTYGSWLPFPVNANCDASEIIGDIQAPSTKINAINIPNARTDGTYRIFKQGPMGMGSGADTCQYSLSSSTSLENQGTVYNNPSSAFSSSLEGNFKFNSTGTKTIQVLSKVTTASGACINYGRDDLPTKWSVHFYPDSSSTIVTQETELTAETANEFNFRVTSTGVVVQDDFDIINGNCTITSISLYNCPLNSGIFTTAPTALATSYNGNAVAVNVNNVSSSSITFIGINSSGSQQVSSFYATVKKSGADVNKSNTIIGNFSQIKSTELVNIELKSNSLQSIPNAAITTYIYGTVKNNSDPNGYYNTSTGVYTSPRKSKYMVCPKVLWAGKSWAIGNVREMDIVTSVHANVVVDRPIAESTSSSFYHLGKCQEIELDENETMTIGVYQSSGVASNIHSDGSFNTLSITEIPDTASIVKNMNDNNTTTCIKKRLNATVTTTGVMTDLTFTDIESGGKYLVKSSFRCAETGTTSTVRSCTVQALQNTNIVAYSNQGHYTSSAGNVNSHSVDINFNEHFIATSSGDLTFDVVTLNASVIIGNTHAVREYVELCKLSDNYIIQNQ